jgi:HEAT repeat protein
MKIVTSPKKSALARALRFRRALPLVAAALLAIGQAPASMADDTTMLARELASGSDFRVRVEAALSLGKTHSTLALEPLSAALDDAHPAVRAAASAALAELGRTEALDLLRSHLAHEPAPSVQTQMRAAIDKLSGAAAQRAVAAARAKRAQVLVKLGNLRTSTAVRGSQLADAFRGATRAKAAELPGVEVLDEASEGAAESQKRKLPVLVLDGALNRLAQGARGEKLTVSAQVEYTFRKIPDHALRGTVTGSAQAEGGAPFSAASDKKVAELETQAVVGAVESAMRAAPEVMLAALR